MAQSRRNLAVLLALVHLTAAPCVLGRRYNVGDLRCWGPPSTSNSHVYSSWSLKHRFKIGDSLMFLYPPSEDSVVQLTKAAFDACVVSGAILKLDDGNSLVNLSSAGVLYFASGVAERCAKHQKLAVNVLYANGSADASASAPAASPSSPASFPVVFGPAGSSSGSAAAPAAAVGSWIAGLMAAAVLCGAGL